MESQDKFKRYPTDSPTEASPELSGTKPAFHARYVVAGRYEILSKLGQGGMGDVWHAYDLKLRVDVALKSLRLHIRKNAEAIEALRREVRTAREVLSPNVCRIYDLVVEEDLELVSMEYIDGITLSTLLQQRAPLPLSEARDIASQFLSGLEAIHRAGLVHRDFKPENVMITRTGRVVVMDFGIAKPVEQISGTLSGTPPYMSPEQLSRQKVDARSDVFAAGIVLAEMIHPDGIRTKEAREALWVSVRKDPPQLPEAPWQKVISRALARKAEDRYASPILLSRALEEVTQRVDTKDEKRPYPGLASFTEADKEYFFGRELEIEMVLKKLHQLHMMAIVGHSGVGKTSFLQAGLIPSIPEDWNYVMCQPGDSPIVNLGRGIAPELSGDTEAIRQMIRFEDPDVAISLLHRWRQKHSAVLLIIDRFEELFTLNSTEIQCRYSELIGRASLEADIHVLLSLRDDFLLRCHDYPQLSPIFSELTPLGALSGSELRRALVEPGLQCGYSFEDDTLVDEIVADVEKERGALPLMAFAASRLWEKRNRDSGLLTRGSYREIGGVAGALAQHAENTMEKIGTERQLIVREIFRNLITSQNTRAARDADELLSVFEERSSAGEVLRALIDARLLTSFDTAQKEGEKPRRRIEIIHESLLSSWPRLVRWQTQDADGAQLRDQLRQTAQVWNERGRPSDLLWTGASYKEFDAWRERFTGGLTANENAFAEAMIQNAGKHLRQRLMAVSAMFLLLLGVLALVSYFWSSEKEARDQAVSEAKRAEASKLLALGRLELDESPTTAIAYAIASLELADTKEARRFAVEALWRGPTGSVVPVKDVIKEFDLSVVHFSTDGKWLSTSSSQNFYVWPQDGTGPWIPGALKTGGTRIVQFLPQPGELVSGRNNEALHIWSIPNKEPTRIVSSMLGYPFVVQNGIITLNFNSDQKASIFSLREISSEPQSLGEWDAKEWSDADIDASGQWLAYSRANEVYRQSLWESQKEFFVGRHSHRIIRVRLDRSGRKLASLDESGELRVWSTAPNSAVPKIFHSLPPAGNLNWDDSGSQIAIGNETQRVIQVFDLAAPPGTDPLDLRLKQVPMLGEVDFHPSGVWLAAANYDRMSFWPMTHKYSQVLRGHSGRVRSIAFAGNQSLVSCSLDGTIRIWPLSSKDQKESSILLRGNLTGEVSLDESGSRLLAGSRSGMFLVSLFDGKPPKQIGGSTRGVAFSPDGMLAASAPQASTDDMNLRIWNLYSGKAIQTLSLRENKISRNWEEGGVYNLCFMKDGRLITSGTGGVRIWNLQTGTFEYLYRSKKAVTMVVSEEAHSVVIREEGEIPVIIDMSSKSARAIPSHGLGRVGIALDPTGTILASGDSDGTIRVGPVTGEEPHLLLGHKGEVPALAISPDGQWIASGGQDGTVRLWPMPQGKPFHTLPYAQFVDRLKALTNVRVVEDRNSASGYRIDYASFPGWKKAPTW